MMLFWWMMQLLSCSMYLAQKSTVRTVLTPYSVHRSHTQAPACRVVRGSRIAYSEHFPLTVSGFGCVRYFSPLLLLTMYLLPLDREKRGGQSVIIPTMGSIYVPRYFHPQVFLHLSPYKSHPIHHTFFVFIYSCKRLHENFSDYTRDRLLLFELHLQTQEIYREPRRDLEKKDKIKKKGKPK